MDNETMTIELTRKQADNLRKFITAMLDGRPSSYHAELEPVMVQLVNAGYGPPNIVDCPVDGCGGRAFRSEQALRVHLIVANGYPEEDAGSTASQVWRNR